MVDAQDLKSCDLFGSCGFESHPRHIRSVAQLVERRVWDAEVPGSNPGTPTNITFGMFLLK